mmetsp:Transcript_69376/g.159354  ORF Transcript_69376/g.159354 Transcript_69376/m.159354 type:complete len:562 (+) Transcript_69376:66-1751(+)
MQDASRRISLQERAAARRKSQEMLKASQASSNGPRSPSPRRVDRAAVCERLYREGREWQEKKDFQAAAARERQKLLDEKSCSFTPKICGPKARRSSPQTFSRLYCDAELRRQKQEEKLAREREQYRQTFQADRRTGSPRHGDRARSGTFGRARRQVVDSCGSRFRPPVRGRTLSRTGSAPSFTPARGREFVPHSPSFAGDSSRGWSGLQDSPSVLSTGDLSSLLQAAVARGSDQPPFRQGNAAVDGVVRAIIEELVSRGVVGVPEPTAESPVFPDVSSSSDWERFLMGGGRQWQDDGGSRIHPALHSPVRQGASSGCGSLSDAPSPGPEVFDISSPVAAKKRRNLERVEHGLPAAELARARALIRKGFESPRGGSQSVEAPVAFREVERPGQQNCDTSSTRLAEVEQHLEKLAQVAEAKAMCRLGANSVSTGGTAADVGRWWEVETSSSAPTPQKSPRLVSPPPVEQPHSPVAPRRDLVSLKSAAEALRAKAVLLRRKQAAPGVGEPAKTLIGAPVVEPGSGSTDVGSDSGRFQEDYQGLGGASFRVALGLPDSSAGDDPG